LAASAIAGGLWTLISPGAAFVYAAASMELALIDLLAIEPSLTVPGDGPAVDQSVVTGRPRQTLKGAARDDMPANTTSSDPRRSHSTASPQWVPSWEDALTD
jgi:hypothetical protein